MRQVLSRTACWSTGRTLLAFKTVPLFDVQFMCRFTDILSRATLTSHFSVIVIAFLLLPLVVPPRFDCHTGLTTMLPLIWSICLLLFLKGGARITKKTWPVSFSQEELRKRLTPMQYHVTQERGTESAFTGELTHHRNEGTYTCVVCGAPLFSSNTKFDSGSGWPSFFDLVKEESITRSDDFSYGMHRVETTCSQCGAHLGHLFDDGPRPTGKRYCINSASLAFQPKQTASSSSSAAEGGAASSSVRDEKTEL